jgi:hypothetical protein
MRVMQPLLTLAGDNNAILTPCIIVPRSRHRENKEAGHTTGRRPRALKLIRLPKDEENASNEFDITTQTNCHYAR